MGRIKEQLGDAPPTIGAARRLGATGLFVTCARPCKNRSRVSLDALRLPDATPLSEVARLRRLVCTACDRRAGPAAISVDWDTAG